MTTDTGARKLVALLCCVAAVVALVAAGVVLLDLPQDLTNESDDGAEDFVSYSVEADGVDDFEVDDDVPETGELEPAVDLEQWEILQPRDVVDDGEVEDLEDGSAEEQELSASADASDPHYAGGGGHQGPTGRLIVITNFTRATVTVNGDTYPSYSDDGQNRGMELPANRSHEILVEFDENERVYDITLEPGEERMLMVELTGSSGSSRPSRSERRSESERSRPQDRPDSDDIDDDEGRITVYSRPRGEIYVGERSTGEQTPSTVDIEPGRHEVQVQYEGGEMSETKTVRVRQGSRVKLFFRQDD